MSARSFHAFKTLALTGFVVLASAGAVTAQSPRDQYQRAAEFFSANVDREEMVRIPMRDGIRLNGSIFFPKNLTRRNLPTILTFFPYQINPASPENVKFIQNGYALAYVNSRGRYFSEGTYTFLIGSGNDSYDTIDWLAKQSWSNGKIGALGCSSSAEEQHKMNAMHHPAFAASVPRGSGAGIGKVGPYDEKGNFYRGGAIDFPWIAWYFEAGAKYKPSFPRELSREDMLRIARYWTLDPNKSPDPKLLDSAIWTLPVNQIMTKLGAMPTDFDRFVNWLPNNPGWKELEAGGEGDQAGAPALYINSWYDISVGPNLAMYQYQAKNAANEAARNNMFMIVAPTLHCSMNFATEHTVVGERDMGDARFDYDGLLVRWFDHWLKGVDNGVEKEPKVRAYLMGANQWKTYDAWPPRESRPVTYYLDSDGGANGREGNGRLVTSAVRKAGQDNYAYDPLNPVPTTGGQFCCLPAAKPGAVDQSTVELRKDVLVYSTAPLTEPVEVTGPVNVSLYLSSDAKDTDLLVKLVDVYPDGKAYNLDEGVQRIRWRQGYQQPVLMETGKVYKVDIPPLVTSNLFAAGHRIRIEVSSSSFPHFERNLNTGGNNYDEKDPVVAHNVIHHGATYPSAIVLSVIPATKAAK